MQFKLSNLAFALLAILQSNIRIDVVALPISDLSPTTITSTESSSKSYLRKREPDIQKFAQTQAGVPPYQPSSYLRQINKPQMPKVEFKQGYHMGFNMGTQQSCYPNIEQQPFQMQGSSSYYLDGYEEGFNVGSQQPCSTGYPPNYQQGNTLNQQGKPSTLFDMGFTSGYKKGEKEYTGKYCSECPKLATTSAQGSQQNYNMNFDDGLRTGSQTACINVCIGINPNEGKPTTLVGSMLYGGVDLIHRKLSGKLPY